MTFIRWLLQCFILLFRHFGCPEITSLLRDIAPLNMHTFATSLHWLTGVTCLNKGLFYVTTHQSSHQPMQMLVCDQEVKHLE